MSFHFTSGVWKLVICYNHQMHFDFQVASMAGNRFSVSVLQSHLVSMDLGLSVPFLVTSTLFIREFCQPLRSFLPLVQNAAAQLIKNWTYEKIECTIQVWKLMYKDVEMCLLSQVFLNHILNYRSRS